MAKRARSRATGLLLGMTAAVTLTACAAGQVAQTAQETPAIDGVSVTIGTIAVRAAAISPPPSNWPQGGVAPVQLVLVNEGSDPDTLTSVTTDAAGGATFFASTTAARSASSSSASASSAPTSGSALATTPIAPPTPTLSAITVQPGQRVSVGFADTDPAIVLTGLRQPLFPAQSFHITLNFSRAGTRTFDIPVHLTDAPSNRPTQDISPSVAS